MSVLLEALKKAAEEKKKQNGSQPKQPMRDEVIESTAMEQSISTSSIAEDVGVPVDEFREPLSLKFNFEVPSSVTPTSDATSLDGAPEEVMHSEMPPHDAEAPVASSVEAEEKVAEVFATVTEKPFEALEQQEEMASNQEYAASVTGSEKHNALFPEVQRENGAFRLQETALEAQTLSDDLETRLAVSELEKSGTWRSESEFSERLEKDPESDLMGVQHHNADDIPDDWGTPASPSVVSQENSTAETLPEHAVRVVASEIQAPSTKEQHDWSLEQIPGYQRYGSTESQQKKTRLILPHLVGKKAHFPSKWRLYGFTGILILLGMAYYTMLYYDQQASEVDTDLKRYQVLSKNRSIEPVVKPLNSVQNVSTNHTVPVSSDKTNEQVPKKVSEGSEVASVESNRESQSTSTSTSTSTLSPKHQAATPKKLAPAAPLKDRKVKAYHAKPKQMTIVSRPQVSKVALAFKAYQAGDWQQAKDLYQQASIEDSGNVAALFGLGAVSVQLGERNKALAYYQKILTLQPENHLAQKAILGIQSSESGNTQTVDALKSLAESNPNDSGVAFALGNVYAKKGDWVEAQSYYFKAYQHEPSQAIYALNLAVSLDQLGEYRLAKQYYDEALSKASPTTSAFNTETIKKRLLVLNQFLGKEH